MRKTYRHLVEFPTFVERFNYLALHGAVGDRTFGSERHLNQTFYNTTLWKRARDVAIIRDQGCDLGIPSRPIFGKIYIHHIEPLTPEDLIECRPCLTDPNNLIVVSHRTHNAIHYGDESLLTPDLVERYPGDTKEW